MNSFSWLSGRIAISLAVLMLAAVAALALGLAYPEPVSSGAFGPDWQCTRLALVFTACTRLVSAKAVSRVEGKGAPCPRPIAREGALRALQ